MEIIKKIVEYANNLEEKNFERDEQFLEEVKILISNLENNKIKNTELDKAILKIYNIRLKEAKVFNKILHTLYKTKEEELYNQLLFLPFKNSYSEQAEILLFKYLKYQEEYKNLIDIKHTCYYKEIKLYNILKNYIDKENESKYYTTIGKLLSNHKFQEENNLVTTKYKIKK